MLTLFFISGALQSCKHGTSNVSENDQEQQYIPMDLKHFASKHKMLGMCRAEMQMVSEEALRSLRIANDALEPLSVEPPKQSGRKSRKKKRRSESSPPMPSAPLEPAEAPQASYYEEEDAPDSNSRNGSSDAISASQGMKEAEERYAVIAERPSSSGRNGDGRSSSQNGSGPDGASGGSQRRANEHLNGSSTHAEKEGGVIDSGSGVTSGGKVALQVTLNSAPRSPQVQEDSGLEPCVLRS